MSFAGNAFKLVQKVESLREWVNKSDLIQVEGNEGKDTVKLTSFEELEKA